MKYMMEQECPDISYLLPKPPAARASYVLEAMLGENELIFSSPELMICVLQYALPTQSTKSKSKMNEWILQWEAQNEDKQYDYLSGQEGKTFPHLLLPSPFFFFFSLSASLQERHDLYIKVKLG